MGKIKQTGQKEIGRIKLGNARELVVSIVDGEKLDSGYGWRAIIIKDGQGKT